MLKDHFSKQSERQASLHRMKTTTKKAIRVLWKSLRLAFNSFTVLHSKHIFNRFDIELGWFPKKRWFCLTDLFKASDHRVLGLKFFFDSQKTLWLNFFISPSPIAKNIFAQNAFSNKLYQRISFCKWICLLHKLDLYSTENRFFLLTFSCFKLTKCSQAHHKRFTAVIF